METKSNEQPKLSAAQEHLMDVFGSISYWASKENHHAFVFLCDGKDYLIFANRHEDLWCNLPMAVGRDPKMAAMFDMMNEGVETFRDSMCEDEPEYKKVYDSMQSPSDLPEYFLYGECFESESDVSGCSRSALDREC
jgi:hypothetical protein